jgi:hypothetical protein
MLDLKSLGKAIAKFAPLLGAVLPIPGGAALGVAIKTAFGADDADDKELANIIAASPDAAVKLRQIEADHKIQIEKILSEQAIAQLNADTVAIGKEAEDRASAREMALKSRIWGIDNIIKGWLAFSSVLIIVICLYGILQSKISEQEVTLINGILNLVAGTYLAMAGFYFGSSFNAHKKEPTNKK